MNAHILAPWCRPSLLLDRFQTEKNECPVAEIFCGQGGNDSGLFPVTPRLYTLLSHLEVSRRNSNEWKKKSRSKPGQYFPKMLNPLNPELNPICYLLALLAYHFLHVGRIRVKLLTLRLLMSYIYIYIYI